MSTNPYDYENRTAIHPISWEDFHGLCKSLARSVVTFQPDMILPVGRAGYYPGTLLAHLLQVELYPIRLSRRVRDIVTYHTPQWLIEPPNAVQDQRVLIVDEICSTGETLTLVKQNVETLGAHAVKSAVLYAHSRGVEVPDYIGIITDALLLNPWDREIFTDGRFHCHPEYLDAFEHLGLKMDASFLIDAPVIEIAKGHQVEPCE